MWGYPIFRVPTVVFGSRRISLADRSRSSFALFYFSVVCMFFFLSLPVLPLAAVSEKSSL
jgi:hypothetical protein